MVVLLCAAAVIAGCGSSVSPGEVTEAPLLPPTNVVAMRSIDGDILIMWDMSTQSNLKGYNVYRSIYGEAIFTKLNTNPITKNCFTDATAQLDVHYAYRVTAVSTKDSESGFGFIDIFNGQTYTKGGGDQPEGRDF